MSRQVWVQKVQGNGRIGFVPSDRADELELERIPYGRDLRADIVVPRSGPYHRLMMATFTLLANVLNSGPGDDVWDRDKVRKRLLVHTGHADVDILPGATKRLYGFDPKMPMVNLEPRSMAWDAMEQDEAMRFFEAAIVYCLAEFGLWVKDHPDWREVLNIGAKLRLGPYEVAA